MRSGVTPENHNASESCGQDVAACGLCSMKQQEIAGPFCLGSPPLKTTTADQFDKALDDTYICMALFMTPCHLFSCPLFIFLFPFCAGGTAVHIPLPLLSWIHFDLLYIAPVRTSVCLHLRVVICFHILVLTMFLSLADDLL